MHPAAPPRPGVQAQRASAALSARIGAAISDAGGRLAFDRFMHMALYEPGLGYYSAGMPRFGAGGDYTTAALMTPLFARTLARQSAEILAQLGGGDILEFGAGTGDMAADCLLELAALDTLPQRYLIIEVSAALRQEQAQTLARRAPTLADRVQWLETLPQAPIRGVVLANELLDALAVKRFRITAEGARELAVRIGPNGFDWDEVPPSAELAAAIRAIEADLGEHLPQGMVSEWCPGLAGWLAAVSHCLAAGAALLIDYGYPRAEYYHPQRKAGTLLCHYRHRAHDDALFYPGLQDITASVDFTAAARAARAGGLEVLGYATQAHFLMGAGLLRLIEAAVAADATAGAAAAQAAKPLLFPGEMGERFKVLALGRGIADSLSGFGMVDHRKRLHAGAAGVL